ncbi:Sodium/hydrogen exchanger 2 [Larimichthys crocea]|uniref:Uncharacterized protein n=1 Tax=Larimichthys crocea TaxID=215358 RepID=A0ACD3QJ08_LARCR|nr:Sodium/hydrogen exchanger 2 [Larimichthys crocea]
MDHTIAGIEDLCGQWSHFYWKDKFMKFNNRILRRILIRDNRAESSIVALYKKLELQNAMEILDTVAGDISAAPSIVSLYEEKKSSAKPKRKFLAADLRNMHDILSKNMYKIRQRTVAYTGKHTLPNDSHTKEILIRRHASIRRSLRPGSFQTTMNQETMSEVAVPLQSLSVSAAFALVLLQSHDASAAVGHPARGAVRRHAERKQKRRERGRTGRGTPRANSSSSDSRVPAPRRHPHSSADSGSADNFRNGHHEAAGEEEEKRQPSSPTPAWAAEPRDSAAQNPLLRRPQWNPKKM